MTSSAVDRVEMDNPSSSTPSLLECIQKRNWQKAIDVIAANREAVYEQKCHSSGRRIGFRPLDDSSHDFHNTSHLAIHELCKITTSPTSVRFSKDEISDDEEDGDVDDESSEGEAAEGLDQIFDACELEEGTKMYEVTQFMIDVSHSIGSVRVAGLRDDGDNDNVNNNNNHLGLIEERRQGIERNESGGSGNDDGDESRNDRQHEQIEDDENSRSHVTGISSSTFHRSILTCADSIGKTPLHVLCENSCDLSMMRVILGSTRESTGNPQAPTALSLLLAKDSRGSTPLHYLAYSRQCPFSTLKLVMEYCKPRAITNEDGEEPSRWINPTLCTDDDGETPLHWALAGYVSSRRIKELTRYSADAIMVQNEKGETPFDQFTTNFVDSDWTDHDICGHEVWENIQEYLMVIQDNQINNQYRKTSKIHYSNHQRRIGGCENVDLESSNQEKNGASICENESEWLPLHFLAGSALEFPPIFLDLALKYCSDDLRKANVDGMLPLHLACGRQKAELVNHLGSKHNEDNEKNNTGNVRNNKSDPLAMKILKKYQRASLKQVTFSKRLALHLAIETRKPLSLIAALIRTYPRSLNIPDPVTKLWPYVLAGVGHDSNESNNNESLSVSFSLLRADPSVLHLVRRNEDIGSFTDRERLRNTTNSGSVDEEWTSEEKSYMEHSSRRIRRLTIRDD